MRSFKLVIITVFLIGVCRVQAMMGLTAQRLGHRTTGILSLFAGTANIGVLNNNGTAARFYQPQGLAFDASGNLWVSDSQAGVIRMIDSNQNVSTVAGYRERLFPKSVDGSSSAARFYVPSSVTYNSTTGLMIVTDQYTCIVRTINSSGTVATLAGGNANCGNATGTGTAARFNNPTSSAVDGAGNMYVTDSTNNLIRKITTGGVVTTLAGSGTAGSADGTGTAATFNYPSGIAIDSAKANLFVVDQGNQTIRKIVISTGVVSTIAGSAGVADYVDGTGAAARFNYPNAITLDSSDTIYISDTGNNVIRKMTNPGAVVTTLVGSGSSGSTNGAGASASFNEPNGLAADGSGNLYVADTANALIRKIVISTKAVSTYAGTVAQTGYNDGTGSAALFSTIFQLAFDSTGKMAVTDADNAVIRSVTTSGVVSTLAGTAYNGAYADGTGASAAVNFPNGIVYDSTSSAFYVADSSNNRIRKLTTAGVMTTYAGTGATGTTNGSLGSATFGPVGGIAVGASSTLYVTDIYNCMIRMITTTTVSTLAGSTTCAYTNATGTSARFRYPRGVAVDSSGNVFVADTENHAIRKITSGGVVTTFAGSASGVSGFVDGTTTAARFTFPMNLTIDGAGNIYVADSGNNAVRKISSAGAVTTVVGNGVPATLLGTLPGGLYFPTSVALSAGKLYISTFGGIFVTPAP